MKLETMKKNTEKKKHSKNPEDYVFSKLSNNFSKYVDNFHWCPIKINAVFIWQMYKFYRLIICFLLQMLPTSALVGRETVVWVV